MQRISAHQNCTLVHLVLSDWWKFSSCRAWKLFLFFSFLKFFKSRFIEVVNPSFCIPLKYNWLVRLSCSLASLFGGCELLGWLSHSWISCFRKVFFTAISFFHSEWWIGAEAKIQWDSPLHDHGLEAWRTTRLIPRGNSQHAGSRGFLGTLLFLVSRTLKYVRSCPI